jgi:hypothetical protein
MRVLLLMVSCLWLTACQTTQDKSTVTAPKKKTSSEAFIDQIKNNGDKMLCSQPGYLQCYRQTRSRCMKDLAAYKDPCIQQTIKKDGTDVTETNYKKFGNDFALCMLVKHATTYPTRAQKIGECLDSAVFNKPVIE